MSHFYTWVIVPTKDFLASEGNLQALCEQQLAEYCEHREVTPYQVACGCVGMAAQRRAWAAAAAHAGTIKELRDTFHAEVMPGLGEDPAEDVTQKAWEEHIAEYTRVTAATLAADPDKDRPNPDCEDCDGEGQRTTTYNPKSKWDWLSVGGRWTGRLIPEYDPVKDPENTEFCRRCLLNGCASCDNTGRVLKHATEWVQKGNWGLLKDVIPRLKANPERYAPRALVTPDGVWHEKGEMGWFGMSFGDKENDAWHREVINLVDEYRENTIVLVVDCHI